MPGGKWTAEEARRHAREGGKARQAQRKAQRANPLAGVRERAAGLMEDLYRAAKGEGDWKNLPPEKRLDALKRYLEYAVGRPAQRKQDEDEEGSDQGGLAFE